MRALDDNRARLLAQVSSLYYEDGFAQEEVARRAGISRSNVSRLLTEARSRGIVEIHVHHPLPTSLRLETELRARFRLRKARVLTSGTRSADLILRDTGVLAAELLGNLLRNDMILGVGWGMALFETVNAFHPVPLENVRVVQMIGGMAGSNATVSQHDGPALVRRLAEAVGGQFRYLHAPNFVENAEVRNALMSERNVRECLEMAGRAEVGLVGIGSVNPDISGFVRAGYLSREELQDIARTGAVGEVCGFYIDVRGKQTPLELHQRLVSIEPHMLKQIDCVVAVAAWKEKAPAILGALRAGLVDILVTDDGAALEVLRLADGAEG